MPALGGAGCSVTPGETTGCCGDGGGTAGAAGIAAEPLAGGATAAAGTTLGMGGDGGTCMDIKGAVACVITWAP